MIDDIPEIECPECSGEGRIWKSVEPSMRWSVECDACHGTGWRTMTADEYDNACEDAYTAQFEGEPPLSAQERHEIAWRQKQELRR